MYTFTISEDQKIHPHGNHDEICINIPKELSKTYQSLSQKGRGSIPIRLEIDDLTIDFVLHPHQYFYHKKLEFDKVTVHVSLIFHEEGQDYESGILIRKFPQTKKKKQKSHRTYEDYQKEFDLLSYMHGFSWAYIQQSENKALKEYQKDINDLYKKYVSRLQKKCLKNTGKALSRK